ncbi:M48 family metallopeptidase [bacterium]|nr:M48 family metallopeptidase [bacterium]
MYNLIEKNKRNSVFLFLALIAVLIVLGFLIGEYFFEAGVYGVVIAGVLATISGLCAFYSGDSIIMAFSRAKRIEKKDHQRLWNVVEEMSIASGLPMPKIYMIDDTAPNAFATGRNPEHASVAITSGLLDKLDREELQGVMAHELSHIQNYDILFGTMIAVMVGTIVLIADFFLRSLFYGNRRRSSSRSSSGGKSAGPLMLIALVFAILAPILARIIQFSVSRQREFLADASAAKMTRNPIGLARALEKISSDKEPLEAANRGTQHLYIVNPLKKVKEKSGLMDTHPPIGERIRILKDLHHV